MNKKILALLLAAFMVIGLLAGCTGNDTPASDAPATDAPATDAPATSAPNGTELNVGVFYYTYDDAYISSVRGALDSALDAKGIKYTNYNCNNEQGTQNTSIQTAITGGANLLIVNLVTSGSSEAAEQVIEMAGGVPVIFFNRAVDAADAGDPTLKGNDNICFIGTDAPEAGHLQGQMVGDYVLANYDTVDLNGDGTISYAMFKGEEGNAEAIARTQYGQEDADAVLTAAGKPALEYFNSSISDKYQVDLTGAWSTQAAVDYMNTNLAQYNEANGNMIELVICNNDGMAEGVVAALQTAGYNNGTGKTIPVFGVDATDTAKDLIAQGFMTGTVKQDAEGMANAIATTAEAIGTGSSVADAVTAAASTGDNFSIAEGVANKLYVAYAAYMGE